MSKQKGNISGDHRRGKVTTMPVDLYLTSGLQGGFDVPRGNFYFQKHT